MKVKTAHQVAQHLAETLAARLGDKCQVLPLAEPDAAGQVECWEVRSEDADAELCITTEAVELLSNLGLQQGDWIAETFKTSGSLVCIRKVEASTLPQEWYELVCGSQRVAIGVQRSTTCGSHTSAMEMVEVPLELCFGRKQLPLSALEELRTDQVLQLDEKVNSPVELLASGKVLARGVAVVVDGCYGIEITEVCV